MAFQNREEAARLLAKRLEAEKEANPLVLGIPRGGMVMAAIIADEMEADLDVVLVRKLGDPENPELAIGVVDEEGNVELNDYAKRSGIPEAYVREERERQLEILKERRTQYAAVQRPHDPAGRSVVVVDDGLATGSTMIGALHSLRARKADRVTVAVAVAPPETLQRVSELAEEVVCLESPSVFFAVGQFFQDFSQVSDEEVLQILGGHRTG